MFFFITEKEARLNVPMSETDVSDSVYLKPDDIITQLGGCGLIQILLSVITQSMKIVVCWVMAENSFSTFRCSRWRCVAFDQHSVNTSSYVGELEGTRNLINIKLRHLANTTPGPSVEYWDERCSEGDAACKQFEYEAGMYSLVNQVKQYFKHVLETLKAGCQYF